MATEKACLIPLVLSTMGIIPNDLHDCVKVRNIRPVLYIRMQKAITVQFSSVQFSSVHQCSLKFLAEK
jgi:hypothetical protein